MAYDHLRHERVTMGKKGWETDAGAAANLRAMGVVSNRQIDEAANESKAKGDLAILRDAIDPFRIDCDRYPTVQEGFDALRNPPIAADGWRGPYLLKDLGNDPWGHPYVYQTPGPNGHDGFLVKTEGSQDSAVTVITDGSE
jgi:type II secretion system protein G